MPEEVNLAADQGWSLDEYRCVKTVRAAQIVDIIMQGDMVEIVVNPHTGPKTSAWQDAGWFNKHHPQIGGYLVQYADGYLSYSPAEAFEAGYIRTGGRFDEIAGRLFNEINMLSSIALMAEKRQYQKPMGDRSPVSLAERFEREQKKRDQR